MTPGYSAALEAVSQTVLWGYGTGIAFVALVLYIKRRGGEI